MSAVAVFIDSVEVTYADGAKRCRLTAGEPLDAVRACVEADGRIMWCEDWIRLSDWYQSGQLRGVYRNGHGDPYAQSVTYYAVDNSGNRQNGRYQSSGHNSRKEA